MSRNRSHSLVVPRRGPTPGFCRQALEIAFFSSRRLVLALAGEFI
jgi:hypothetical protein